jgi:ATP-dependent Clp protease protease subunit
MLDDEEEEKEEKKPEAPDAALTEKMLKTRTILLSGEINKDLAEKTVRQLLLLENTAKDENDAIKVFIDSPGGDADSGFAIFDMFRFVKCPVITLGMGLVASAAASSLLAAPPEHRLGLPTSHYLIHQPLSGLRGVATDIEISAREIEKLRVKINKLISDETGVDMAQVEKDTNRDYWLDAKEATTYGTKGLISKVIVTRKEFEQI